MKFIPPASRVAALAALGLSITNQSGLRADDVNNFDAGNINGWSTFDLTPVLHSFGVPGTYATYTFPSDGQGGKALEIATPTLPDAVGSNAGPPRAFAFPTTQYTRLLVHADVLNWNNSIDQAFGLLFMGENIGPGSTDGYVMNYNVSGKVVQINTIAGEAPTTIAETPLPMDPSKHTYRWELSVYSGNILGRVFQLPDVNNPLGSVVATDSTTTSGLSGLFNFDRTSNPPYIGTDSTFDNYDATAPAAGSLAAVPVFLSPAPGGSTLLAQPAISIAVLDRETTANRSSFSLTVDGVTAPAAQVTVSEGVNVPNNTTPFSGPTVSYTPSSPLAPGVHQVQAVFADSAGTHFTNTWSFTANYLATPVVGTPGAAGFNVFIVQAPQSPQLPNSIDEAMLQLATNSTVARLYATNVVAPYINFDAKAFDNPGGNSVFANDLPFPGQSDDVTVANWAMQVTTYLNLPAGIVTMGVKHDDGYQVSSQGTVLGYHSGGTGDDQFSFYVAQAGLYPFTMLFNQSGGAAYVDWYEVTPTEHSDTGNEVLLNTLDGFAAYTSVVAPPPTLLASTSVSGPYQAVAGATADTAAQTFTVPITSAAPDQFFRVSASGSVTISSVKAAAGNLVIGYALH